MELNPATCKEIVKNFMPNHNFLLRPIVIGNNTVERVNKYKVLGVILRNDLKWGDHIEYIYKNASNKLDLIRVSKLSGVRPSNILKVYLSIIRPTVDLNTVFQSDKLSQLF